MGSCAARFSMSGPNASSTSRTSRRHLGPARPPTKCWRAAATSGGCPNAGAVEEIKAEKLLKDLASVWKELGPGGDGLRRRSGLLDDAAGGDHGRGDEQDLAGTLGDLMHSIRAATSSCGYWTGPSQSFPHACSPSVSWRSDAASSCAVNRSNSRPRWTGSRISMPWRSDSPCPTCPCSCGYAMPGCWSNKSFQTLCRLARPLIIDSAQFVDAQRGCASWNAVARAGWRIKDLAWSRLTVWRETIAQMFETERRAQAAPQDRSRRSQGPLRPHGKRRAVLGAWLGQRLPGAR